MPSLVVSWCLLCHHPLLSQLCPDIQTFQRLRLSLLQSLLCLLFVYSILGDPGAVSGGDCDYFAFLSIQFQPHYLLVGWSCSVCARIWMKLQDYVICKVEVFKPTCEVPSDAISVSFSCSLYCPVNNKQEKKAWQDTSLFNASGNLKLSCLFSLFQYRTLNDDCCIFKARVKSCSYYAAAYCCPFNQTFLCGLAHHNCPLSGARFLLQHISLYSHFSS